MLPHRSLLGLWSEWGVSRERSGWFLWLKGWRGGSAMQCLLRVCIVSLEGDNPPSVQTRWPSGRLITVPKTKIPWRLSSIFVFMMLWETESYLWSFSVRIVYENRILFFLFKWWEISRRRQIQQIYWFRHSRFSPIKKLFSSTLVPVHVFS